MTNQKGKDEFQRVSGSEMEIMQAVWALSPDGKTPVTSAQLQTQLSSRQWKATTVLTFLSRLCDKGLLEASRQGKSNLYTPLLTEEEYRRLETRAFLDEVHGGSLRSFIAALADEDLSGEELDELRDWFEKR